MLGYSDPSHRLNELLKMRLQTTAPSVANFGGMILTVNNVTLGNADARGGNPSFFYLLQRNGGIVEMDTVNNSTYPFRRVLIGTVSQKLMNKACNGIKNLLKDDCVNQTFEDEALRIQRDNVRVHRSPCVSPEKMFYILPLVKFVLYKDALLFSYDVEANLFHWEGVITGIKEK